LILRRHALFFFRDWYLLFFSSSNFFLTALLMEFVEGRLFSLAPFTLPQFERASGLFDFFPRDTRQFFPYSQSDNFPSLFPLAEIMLSEFSSVVPFQIPGASLVS